MRSLSAHDLLDVWEWGQGKSSARRALGLLAAAAPEVPAGELEEMSLGRRNRWLLAIRESLFGPTFACLADCPSCCEPVELVVEAPAPADEGERPDSGGLRMLEAGGFEVRWRTLSSRDLLAIDDADPDEGRAILLRRVVVEARRGGEPLAAEAIPEEVRGALLGALERADPLARLECGLTCPACGHGWQAMLDIADFLWSEVEVLARRLLHEVHALASAYGWREDEVLALPHHRRRAYLEMLGA
jgi:hypothetical protein